MKKLKINIIVLSDSFNYLIIRPNLTIYVNHF